MHQLYYGVEISRAELGEWKMGAGPFRRLTQGELWHNRDFVRLWTGQTISRLGDQFTGLAIPFIAALIIHASPFEMGILTTALFGPWLIFGLPVGVWVDRHRRRRLMIIADIGRGLVVGMVPVAAFFGIITMPILYLVSFLEGTLTVFFDVAYQSYIPDLVERRLITDANSKLEASRSTAQIAGPSLAGIVIAIVTAPFAMIFDALSFAASALFLVRIKKHEERLRRTDRLSLRREIKEGFSVILRDARLRSLMGCGASSNLFSNAIGTLYFLFAAQQLGFDVNSSAEFGIIFTLGSVGALVGALISSRVAFMIGVGNTMMLSIFIATLGNVTLPIATPATAFPLLILGSFIGSTGSVVYNVNTVSFRQSIVPQRLQGRLNATNRFIIWGTIPIGGILGGLLGQVVGLRTAIIIAAVGGILSFLWILFSPVRGLRTIPEAAE